MSHVLQESMMSHIDGLGVFMRLNKVTEIKYFSKFSNDFNKQDLKWKLIAPASCSEIIFQNFEISTKKLFFFRQLFRKTLFSANMSAGLFK